MTLRQLFWPFLKKILQLFLTYYSLVSADIKSLVDCWSCPSREYFLIHVVESHFSFLQGQIEYLSELWPLNQTLSLSSLTGQLRRKDTLQGKRSLQMV